MNVARIARNGTEVIGGVGRLGRISGRQSGRPCLRGLRIRVKDVLDLLAGDASRQEILQDHPLLEDSDITAALEYPTRQSGHPVPPVA